MRPQASVCISETRAAIVVLLLFTLLISQAALAEAPEPPPIAISVFGDIVNASGLTAGGEVAVLAIWSNTVARGNRSSATLQATTRADSGGSASVTFPQQLPANTLIAVIDIKSGRVEVLAENTSFRRIDLTERRLKRDGLRDVDAVLSPFEFAVTVLVRPAVGAWIHVGGDGGASDDDGQPNGGVRTRPGTMTRIGDGPPAPPKITPRDILLSVGLHAGVFSVAEVNP